MSGALKIFSVKKKTRKIKKIEIKKEIKEESNNKHIQAL
jgi:hypothetical protein